MYCLHFGVDGCIAWAICCCWKWHTVPARCLPQLLLALACMMPVLQSKWRGAFVFALLAVHAAMHCRPVHMLRLLFTFEQDIL
jgi:hypothetical protein